MKLARMKITEWLSMFITGWRRRSKMILDNCGCPTWLIRWRCPTPEYLRGNWGAILRSLSDYIDPTND